MTQETDQKAIDEFQLARAGAINEYALLEISLADLHHQLLGAEIVRSYFLFSRMMSAPSRRGVLLKLFEMSGLPHSEFFKSLMKQISELEDHRNKIVHWPMMISQRGSEPFDPNLDIGLHESPNIFGAGKLGIEDLRAFSKKTIFLSKLVFSFSSFIRLGRDLPQAEGTSPWSKIFAEKVTFPPADDHPLKAYAS